MAGSPETIDHANQNMILDQKDVTQGLTTPSDHQYSIDMVHNTQQPSYGSVKNMHDARKDTK
ncbi:hypothetical protein FUT69_01505 [Xylella taiwanensis]|uniref:Uncharacterized protein n=1 Tax=Xylella taiwanensis TaxID=1444770 RepID=Z9JM65_9GAMM|nr:hypothetical protein [Xylella taiwanensis]AXI84192.1 hypothetical protein AB672_09710 [Xylella taiwanensis]EWS78926.1 hypothetical protein AF72_03130 [Xylella taiwanensis]MCD8457310.1 hypothetical protein [Xylella taiwanensis]MCD8459721.1 hypothetical protein [Xylella taiwanensis]MCD8461409.1 hypothetical protein [Xylella taiwanensis]